MANPKHDYGGEEFYQQLYALAINGASDSEIAHMLEPSLDPSVFSRMKAGKYEGWNEEENKEYSEHISQVLARARVKTNYAVRATYLKTALGKEKLVSVVERAIRDEDGNETGQTLVQKTTSDVPANQQAMATWLFHHDPEWREMQMRMKTGIAEDEGSEEITGINVNIAYTDKEHLELQGGEKS